MKKYFVGLFIFIASFLSLKSQGLKDFDWGLSIGKNISWSRIKYSNSNNLKFSYDKGNCWGVVYGFDNFNKPHKYYTLVEGNFITRKYNYEFNDIHTTNILFGFTTSVVHFLKMNHKKEGLLSKVGAGIVCDALVLNLVSANNIYNKWIFGKYGELAHYYFCTKYILEQKTKKVGTFNLGLSCNLGFARIYSTKYQIKTHTPNLERDHYRGSFVSINLAYLLKKRETNYYIKD